MVVKVLDLFWSELLDHQRRNFTNRLIILHLEDRANAHHFDFRSNGSEVWATEEEEYDGAEGMTLAHSLETRGDDVLTRRW